MFWLPPFEIDLSDPEPRKIDPMDQVQETWDALRAQGHEIGDIYNQVGAPGLYVVVDDVAMSFRDAHAVSKKWVTVAQVAEARSRPAASRT